MRFGISLLRVHPERWVEVATAAEELGYESVWMSDHLVLPKELNPDVYPDRELPIKTQTPVFDVMVYLANLAARTSTLRLGTYVFQLGLRHPFVSARAITTLDVVSGGRVELGVGAGWLPEEWAAAGVEFTERGSRLDEALAVCRDLWTLPSTERREGKHFRFPPVAFEPKPVQRPHPPVHIGGESMAALRRAVGWDGWIGMHHTPESVADVLGRLRSAADSLGRTTLPEVTVAAEPGSEDTVDAWRATGVDRLLVTPWRRSRDALQGMTEFARRHLG